MLLSRAPHNRHSSKSEASSHEMMSALDQNRQPRGPYPAGAGRSPLATLRRNAGTLTPDNRETPRRLSVSLLPRLGDGTGPNPFVTLAMVDVPTPYRREIRASETPVARRSTHSRAKASSSACILVNGPYGRVAA